MPALTAAAALLTDYVLTVSVSVVAGIAALTSAVPELRPYRIVLGVGVISITMFVGMLSSILAATGSCPGSSPTRVTASSSPTGS